MNVPARGFAAGLLALALAGCGTPDSPRTEPDRPIPELPLPPTMAVEKPALHSLWLPEPGPSTKAALRPRAEAARKRGLEAARGADWAGAVAAFEEAQEAAPFAPSIVFNLALAHQKAGHPVQAAMWYRLWLEMEPDAPNAAEVRGEMERQIAAAEERANALFDEAERLAETLSAEPPSRGAASLRQAALEAIAGTYYGVGLVENAKDMLKRAGALPGAAEVAEPVSFWDRRGLIAARWCWNPDWVEQILSAAGGEYEPEKRTQFRIQANWARGNLQEVAALLAENPDYALSPTVWGIPTRAYGEMETVLKRNLRSFEAKTELDYDWYANAFLATAESAFWDGRPDVARRLAYRAREYYRRVNLNWYRQAHPAMTPEFEGGTPGRALSLGGGPPVWHYILTCAILGDMRAIDEEMRRWRETSSIENYPLASADEPCGRAALFLFATLPPEERTSAIERLLKWATASGPGAVVGAENVEWEHWFPLGTFAWEFSRGNLETAVQPLVLQRLDESESQKRLLRALKATASCGWSAVSWLASRVHRGDDVVLALNRYLRERVLDTSGREELEAIILSTSGGWRPRNPLHSNAVWLALRRAVHLRDWTLYDLGPRTDEAAKSRPEQLPNEIARVAGQIWAGVLVAKMRN